MDVDAGSEGTAAQRFVRLYAAPIMEKDPSEDYVLAPMMNAGTPIAGHFSEMFVGRDRKTGRKVAVKRIRRGAFTTPKAMDEYFRGEFDAHNRLMVATRRSPFLVELVAAYRMRAGSSEHYFIVTALAGGGDFIDWILSNPAARANEATVRSIAFQAAAGLADMHYAAVPVEPEEAAQLERWGYRVWREEVPGVGTVHFRDACFLHRDIKPDNMFIISSPVAYHGPDVPLRGRAASAQVMLMLGPRSAGLEGGGEGATRADGELPSGLEDPAMRIVLGDFGAVEEILPSEAGGDMRQTRVPTRKHVGTPAYNPPESPFADAARGGAMTEGYWTATSDIWQLCASLVVPLTGDFPFVRSRAAQIPNDKVRQHRNRCEGRYNTLPEAVSAELADFVRRGLVVDSAARPGTAAALHHQWLLPEVMAASVVSGHLIANAAAKSSSSSTTASAASSASSSAASAASTSTLSSAASAAAFALPPYGTPAGALSADGVVTTRTSRLSRSSSSASRSEEEEEDEGERKSAGGGVRGGGGLRSGSAIHAAAAAAAAASTISSTSSGSSSGSGEEIESAEQKKKKRQSFASSILGKLAYFQLVRRAGAAQMAYLDEGAADVEAGAADAADEEEAAFAAEKASQEARDAEVVFGQLRKPLESKQLESAIRELRRAATDSSAGDENPTVTQAQFEAALAAAGLGGTPLHAVFESFARTYAGATSASVKAGGQPRVPVLVICRALAQMTEPTRDTLRHVFSMYDLNGDGRLSLIEVAAVLRMTRTGDVQLERTKFDRMAQLFQELDSEHTGTVSFEDFVRSADQRPELLGAFLHPNKFFARHVERAEPARGKVTKLMMSYMQASDPELRDAIAKSGALDAAGAAASPGAADWSLTHLLLLALAALLFSLLLLRVVLHADVAALPPALQAPVAAAKKLIAPYLAHKI